ncbi:GGDEF domain-containing protein [Vibrio sp. Y2-5]|uniref:GGDEF domain-containing protein n=1 Tax=Vibrio sp. Y2-5 TaxID=2743977 RepID=UPI00166128CB|nr:GGDEF domain-containing protein [Vibrio sp. Y2-5]MBD0788042.1 GGDEF domain-containing protein [Vibrio sp. Y2-5]
MFVVKENTNICLRLLQDLLLKHIKREAMVKKHIFRVILLISTVLVQHLCFANTVAVCNTDQIICSKLGSEDIKYGLLPFALSRHKIDSVDYIDYPKALLDELSFDVALLPKTEAQYLLKNGDFTVYDIPLKNSIIKLTPDNLMTERLLGTRNACDYGRTDLKCVSIEQALGEFNQGLASIVGFDSVLTPFIPSLQNVRSSETLDNIAYVLLVNNESPLASINLRSDLIQPSFLDGYVITVLILALILLLTGCTVAYVHFKSQIDEQSGCYSKKMFEKTQNKASSKPKTIMLIDYNNFKSVNDIMGHPVGDRVIELVSSELIGILRKNDKIYRIGGDEFFVEFSNYLPDSRVIQLRQNMEEAAARVSNQLGLDDIEFGLAVGHKALEAGETIKDAYKIVDEQMYIQKKAMKASR